MRKRILRVDVRSTSFHFRLQYLCSSSWTRCLLLLFDYFCCYCCPQRARTYFNRRSKSFDSYICLIILERLEPRGTRANFIVCLCLCFISINWKSWSSSSRFFTPKLFKFPLIIVLILRWSISWFFVPSFISKKPSKRARGTCYLRGSGYHVVVVCFGWRCCTNVANGTTSKKKVGVNESFKKCPFQDSFVHPLFQV